MQGTRHFLVYNYVPSNVDLLMYTTKRGLRESERDCVNTVLTALLHIAKKIDGKLNSRHSGLLRPDYSEKGQGRWTSGE